MKIAISGKGGVGKTTFAANFARWLSNKGITVLAVDADPDASLGTILGISDDVLSTLKPIVDMKDLIEERMGGSGTYYPLNPNVDDILDDYCIPIGDLRFFRMGNIKGGGTSCYCKENSFLRALVNSLILGEKDTVILDMGAGIEQLTRGTALGVDVLVIVTEPSKVSVQTVKVIQQLASELGIPRVVVVGNKVRNPKDESFLRDQFPSEQLIGVIPYSEELLEMSLNTGSIELPGGSLGVELNTIYQRIANEGR
ncbi:CO dehydrogenase maturation factor [Desulfosporosinus orientis DSM 765]|uniref:CO dehydrogenase maturation factor n=1 Tax=Desulfosporosinus orientis (strain ATCC 19365 / DSM 765 / NCIMB 8382 / VKM B-1628 / Singapore I) TaxID=768706 RepID=G7WBM0_DESOD|nr:P-loop NTPase [Desulfosporosinus orientis]AET68778.1 CO dehydrogenase maturation factor [Desulfosporosinus orientis DSM 765]